ncbi:hypothetical protein AB0L56_05945 [Streptomyces sp. NPDC052079]|uniref:hypothetical protein n=1 Tax=Streptomyces sp. NPDC052079 TaxID=3155526 RepID=UPI003419EB1D
MGPGASPATRGHRLTGHLSESEEELRWPDDTPDLWRETVNLILRRTSYDCRRVLEAETIATIVMEQIVSDGFTALPGPRTAWPPASAAPSATGGAGCERWLARHPRSARGRVDLETTPAGPRPLDRSLLAVVLWLLCTAGSFSVALAAVSRALAASR